METKLYKTVTDFIICSNVLYFLFAFLFPFGQMFLARAPPRGQSPFVFVWNAPTELCMTKFKLNVDYKLFQIVGSTLASARAQNISLFYIDRLGHFPFIHADTGQSYNGGIPQMTNINRHLQKAKEDIIYYIPSDTQKGLAVIDWEEWRPTWIRNWASKHIYRAQSIEYELQKDLTLTREEATSKAKAQFESSAKKFMLKTIRLGKLLRPQYLWGFYLFPNCHNYDYNQNPHNYTGRCPEIEMLRNDKLEWLWKESTAFYPSIYLETSLKSTKRAALYSRHRVQEAVRLSTLSNPVSSLPIYVYVRLVFTDDPTEYLSKGDLVNTIGESAALGATGVIMWGDVNQTRSVNTCTTLNNYIMDILNPYIINITLAAKLCSTVLCQNNGACVRKQWNSNHYLHLNGKTMVIQQKSGIYSVRGHPTIEDLNQFVENFKCHCYSGKRCKVPSNLQNIGKVNICMSPNICINTCFNSKFNPNLKSKIYASFTAKPKKKHVYRSKRGSFMLPWWLPRRIMEKMKNVLK